MQELASRIRDNLELLSIEYAGLLQETEGYDELSDEARLELARNAIQSMAASLEAGDPALSTQSLRSAAAAQMGQGFELKSVDRALNVLAESLERVLTTVEAANSVWRVILEVKTALAESTMEKLQAEQRRILDAVPAMIWYKDAENRILRLNRAAAATMGLSVEEVQGRSVYELNPAEAAQYHQDDLEVVRSGEAKLGIVEPLVTASGETRWLQTDKVPYLDEEGQIIGVIVFALDITERKRAEEALQQSQQMLQLTMDNIPQSISWKDLDLVYLGCNRNFAADAGLGSPEEIIGLNDFDMPWVEQADLYRADDLLVMKSGEPKLNYEEPQTTPDGKQIWLRTGKVPLRDTQGDVTAVLGMYEDITERKRLEQDIRESLERRGRQVQISTQVAQEISAAPALDELYRRVVTLVKEQFGYYHAQLFLFDGERARLVTVAGYGEVGQQFLEQGHFIPLGMGVVGRAGALGRPLLSTDVSLDPEWLPHPLLPETEGELAVPIKIRDQVLGVLDVQSDTAGALSEEDQLLLEGLCGQIAVAIESTRLRQETEESLRELERLYRALSREGWEAFRRQALATGYLFDQTEVFATDGLGLPEAEPAMDGPALALFPPTGGVAAVAPLSVRGEPIGTLGVEHDPQNPLSEEELALVESVATQVAQALESARLFQETQSALAETEGLYQASADLNSAQTYDQILDALRGHTILGQADRSASISLFDRPWIGDELPGWILTAARWTRRPMQDDTRYRIRDYPSVTRLLRPDEPTIVIDAATDPRLDDNARALYVEQYGVRSTIAAPLVAGGRWLGYVDGLFEAQTEFPENQVRRLMALVSQAAVAVQNLQQLAEIRARAERERTVRTATDRLRRGTDAEAIMRTGLEELSRMLGTSTMILRLGSRDQLGSAPSGYEREAGRHNIQDMSSNGSLD